MLASLLALGSGASKDERKKRAETRGLAQTGSRTGQLPLSAIFPRSSGTPAIAHTIASSVKAWRTFKGMKNLRVRSRYCAERIR